MSGDTRRPYRTHAELCATSYGERCDCPVEAFPERVDGCPCGSGVAEVDCHPGVRWADVKGSEGSS